MSSKPFFKLLLIHFSLFFAQSINSEEISLKISTQVNYESKKITFKQDQINKSNLIEELIIIDPSIRDFINNAPKKESKLIEYVNSYVNKSIQYTSDSYQFGQKDKWLTIFDTFTSHEGDCEDFAIAKYYLLRELGVPVKSLRLTYGKINKKTAHMVLVYSPNKKLNLILDNMITSIKPTHMRKDFEQIYSFNDEYYYDHLNKYKSYDKKLEKVDTLNRSHDNYKLLLSYLKNISLTSTTITSMLNVFDPDCIDHN